MLRTKDLYEKYGTILSLKLLVGEKGLNRKIRKPDVIRPSISLTGFLKWYRSDPVLILGRVEIAYLLELPSKLRKARLDRILQEDTPAVILARNHIPPKELLEICTRKNIPLFRTPITTMKLISKIIVLLQDDFTPSVTLHGTLVEVFGIGVLLQGDSSVGKSEAALGLVERGHRLISDDMVKIKKKEGILWGSGPDLIRHLMEIRGVGIINIAHLHGAVCVKPDNDLNIIIKLEEWNDTHFYDRVGLEEKFTKVLDVNIPVHTLPVKPGRDVVLLIETVTLNHRLKHMGYNSAKEFNAKLLDAIEQKNKNRAFS